MGKHKRHGHDQHKPAQQRNAKAAPGLPHGAVVGRKHHVGAARKQIQKVKPHAGLGQRGQLGAALAVENGHHGIGACKQAQIHHTGQPKAGKQARAQKLRHIFIVSAAALTAEQRLHTLGKAAEQRRHHQPDVAGNAVGRHAHIACKAQQNGIEAKNHHTVGHLGHKSGAAKACNVLGNGGAGAKAHTMKVVVLFQAVAAQHQQAHNGRAARGQRRAEHSKAHGKNKNIVEYNIKQAAEQRAHHHKAGRAIVAHKALHHGVQQKEGRKHQHHPQILGGNGQHLTLGPKGGRKALGGGGKAQKRQREQSRQPKGLREGFFILPQRIAGGSANAHHGPQAENDIEDRQRNVQRGKAQTARAQRNKIGIGQNIAAGAGQPENAWAYIAHKFRLNG